jgi:hypothetical protein
VLFYGADFADLEQLMQGQTALDFAGLKHLFVHAYPQRLYQHDCSSSAIGKRTLYSIKHMQQIGFEA